MDLNKLKAKATLKDRYGKQLQRLQKEGISTECVEAAVSNTVKKLAGADTTAMVIYGEPQSGKTEMMICLTAKLLDEGNPIIVHLLNDSVDLLSQNLKRFKAAGLAPAAKLSSELKKSEPLPNELVVLCKKNTKDLKHLSSCLAKHAKITVVDDEADYATPNSKINQGTKTKINDWVTKLRGASGRYIGVTATPARLDLNNTLGNDTDKWVKFPPHKAYTGQDIFFPLDPKDIKYRLTRFDQSVSAVEAENALVRFLVTVAYLNSGEGQSNYSMLVHTSGKKADHEADRIAIEKTVAILRDPDSHEFEDLAKKIDATAKLLYPLSDPQALGEYIVANASMATLVVLNSKRDRKVAGDNATEPSSPFTIIIGGNIVSRGVTFPNLLSMFFTRSVRSKLQQDTYIQRARMFGARGQYLKHFELTIPENLYDDWHKCFVYHKLSLATIENNLGVPVWLADKKVAVASSPSIDKSTVTLDKGEMSFGIFQMTKQVGSLIAAGPSSAETLEAVRELIGEEALPTFLIKYIQASLQVQPGTLAIHAASSIEGYAKTADQEAISRAKGFIGSPQLEKGKFPNALHHIKVFSNAKGAARVFYKKVGGLSVLQNLKNYGKQA